MFISRSQGFFCYLVPIEYAVTVVSSIITKSTCAKRIMIVPYKLLSVIRFERNKLYFCHI